MKLFVIVLLFSSSCFAWGRRGHSIVCQTAAALLAHAGDAAGGASGAGAHAAVGAPSAGADAGAVAAGANANGASLMLEHAFDLGYYCNVPDLIWKKPTTYAVEAPQHFMDLEIFQRAFAARPPGAGAVVADPFMLSRAEFDRAFPSVDVKAGRSYWRIREFMDSLEELQASLKKSADAKPEARFADQEAWLVRAGAMGHYVGDLSQPLHVTEDYDGQMENQKGIHAFFEDTMVDVLSSTDHPGKLEADVGALALARWSSFSKKNSGLSVLQLLEQLATDSNAARPDLLKIDKRIGRTDLRKAARAYEPMIRSRLAAGALTLALLWSRVDQWPYTNAKFYNFTGAPEYIKPPSEAPPAAAH